MRRMWVPISLQAPTTVATLPVIAVMQCNMTTRPAPSLVQDIPTSAITRQGNLQRIIKASEWASAPTLLPPRLCDPQPLLVQMPSAEPTWNSSCCYLAPRIALAVTRTPGRLEVKKIHKPEIAQLARNDSLWLATWTIIVDKVIKSTEVFIFPRIEVTNGRSMMNSSKSKGSTKRIMCPKSHNR